LLIFHDLYLSKPYLRSSTPICTTVSSRCILIQNHNTVNIHSSKIY
jgi:hypothetical protein